MKADILEQICSTRSGERTAGGARHRSRHRRAARHGARRSGRRSAGRRAGRGFPLRPERRGHAIAEGEFFVNIHNPPLRLVIIGAVHIAQALIPMAQAAGYDVIVIDPRGAFATADRFPDVELHAEWPDEVAAADRPRSRARRCSPSRTIPRSTIRRCRGAQVEAASTSARSDRRRRTPGARERLTALGFSPSCISRIHGPIGLAIGAHGRARDRHRHHGGDDQGPADGKRRAMKFGEIETRAAAGRHSRPFREACRRRVQEGPRADAGRHGTCSRRAASTRVFAARLDADDVPEDEAAAAVARAIAGEGAIVQEAFTGRANFMPPRAAWRSSMRDRVQGPQPRCMRA